MNIQAALVRSILQSWAAYEWTQQGFGFLRTKIANVGRIHVWDSRLRVPMVSDVHDHPWDFLSTIVSGELVDTRFLLSGAPGLPYHALTIATGEGGGPRGEARPVELETIGVDFYRSGNSYEHQAKDIHRTQAVDGTVTLLERNQGSPLEEATVYFPRGVAWVSAEPRPVEAWEAQPIIMYALRRWSA